MLDRESRLESELAEVIRQRDEEHAERKQLESRLRTLHAILTDPVYQLEFTKGGYYIYRFDLEAMQMIANAIGVPQVKAAETLASYTPEELTRLIK